MAENVNEDAGKGGVDPGGRTAAGAPAPESKRSPAFWPLFLTGALLLAAAGCFLYMWHSQRGAYAEEYARLAQLEQRKRDLNTLMALPPCEAQERLRPPQAPPASSGAAARPVSEAAPAPQAAAARGAGAAGSVERACVFIVSPSGRNRVSTGSGFFVAPGYVATNRHVVEGSNGNVLVTSKALGRPAKGHVSAVSKSKNADFAIIKVEMPQGAQVSVLPISQQAQKTEKVGAWGFPDLVGKNDPAYARLLRGEDLRAVPELSYTEGVISAILPRQPEIIVHTAPISPGNSGGPLVNGKGEAVGINTMIQLDESSFRQASLALSAADLLRFLAENGIKK